MDIPWRNVPITRDAYLLHKGPVVFDDYFGRITPL